MNFCFFCIVSRSDDRHLPGRQEDDAVAADAAQDAQDVHLDQRTRQRSAT